jgi:hypothetical protein
MLMFGHKCLVHMVKPDMVMAFLTLARVNPSTLAQDTINAQCFNS